mgnify:CR=1 FL=1
MPERNTMKKIQELQQVKGDAYDYYIAGNEDTDLFEKIFLVEEIKDINLEIGAANLFLQRAENQDELKVILAKGEMAHFHVTKQENQLEMSYKKNGKISREETDEIIVQIPENHHLENMSVSIGAGKLKAENITVMERLGLEVGAGKAKLKNMHVRNLAIECGVGKCHYEGVRTRYESAVWCRTGRGRTGRRRK